MDSSWKAYLELEFQVYNFLPLGILDKNVKVHFPHLVSNSHRDDKMAVNENVSVRHFNVFKSK